MTLYAFLRRGRTFVLFACRRRFRQPKRGGNNPVIDSVLSDTRLPRGEISINGKVVVNGRMLWATGDTVKVLFKDAEGDVAAEADTFESTSSDLLTFQCPDGLSSGMKYSVVVERTDANGIMRTSAPKTVTAR